MSYFSNARPLQDPLNCGGIKVQSDVRLSSEIG